MRRVRIGFTIVEVSLFLAVTGLLFIGITVGVQNSIFQQRYTDAVQGFADYLRNIYAEVLNVQSVGSGTSDLAIYGKMVVFGKGENDNQDIRAFDVVGDVELDINSSDYSKCVNVTETLEMLRCRNIAVNVSSEKSFAGIVDEYKARWGTKIQAIENNETTGLPEYYRGAILVVRNPETGRVYTGVEKTPDSAVNLDDVDVLNVLNGLLKVGVFNNINDDDGVDYCVNPNGDEPSSRRADVRIEKGAINASGVTVIMDGDNNRCNGS